MGIFMRDGYVQPPAGHLLQPECHHQQPAIESGSLSVKTPDSIVLRNGDVIRTSSETSVPKPPIAIYRHV